MFHLDKSCLTELHQAEGLRCIAECQSVYMAVFVGCSGSMDLSLVRESLQLSAGTVKTCNTPDTQIKMDGWMDRQSLARSNLPNQLRKNCLLILEHNRVGYRL